MSGSGVTARKTCGRFAAAACTACTQVGGAAASGVARVQRYQTHVKPCTHVLHHVPSSAELWWPRRLARCIDDHLCAAWMTPCARAHDGWTTSVVAIDASAVYALKAALRVAGWHVPCRLFMRVSMPLCQCHVKTNLSTDVTIRCRTNASELCRSSIYALLMQTLQCVAELGRTRISHCACLQAMRATCPRLGRTGSRQAPQRPVSPAQTITTR